MSDPVIDDEILNIDEYRRPFYPKALTELVRRLGGKYHIKMHSGVLPAPLVLRDLLQAEIDADPDPGSIIYYLKLIIISLIDTLIDHQQRIVALEST